MNAYRPKVSIVLPTYNGEKYLRESINSVIAQKFTDWELIIVNDGSKDGTLDIINEYAASNSRIVVVNNAENKKLPESLNAGFRYARGEYLTWTSDDNRYLPDAIGRMVSFLDNNRDIYLVRANMDMMDGNGAVTGKYFIDFDNVYIYYNNCVGACFMYRREALDEIGEYDPEMILIEDYDYWLRILFRYGKIGNIDETLYVYRFHAGSLTSIRQEDFKRQRLKLRLRYLDGIIARLKGHYKYLYAIYYESKETSSGINAVLEKLRELLPLIEMEAPFDSGKRVVVYGAGDFGDRAYKRLDGKIDYYADKDKNKAHTYKNGVEILSVDEMLQLDEDYQIVLGAGPINVYDMLSSLKKLGINKVCLYNDLPKAERTNL